jgi:sulfoxide reductase heme-binding subunit YedZ
VVLSRRLDWRWVSAKALAHALLLLPFAAMVRDAMTDGLGADPIDELTHRTGAWALRALLLCLAMTPLRRLVGTAWPIRFRRLLGLYAFFYASAHLAVYVVLDLGGWWAQVLEDIAKRPFMTVGFAAWLLLVPQALTSTQRAMRWLGRKWALLHRTAYVAAALGVLHFLWGVKADLREPLVYAAILAVLLGARVAWWWARSVPARAEAGVAAQPPRGE